MLYLQDTRPCRSSSVQSACCCATCQDHRLFAQGIGLSLDSALAFWRTEFAKGGMPEDKFKKEHMYNIRHSYGKEGKRVNYTPASCMSVINSQPGEVRQIQYMQSFPFPSADGVPLQMRCIVTSCARHWLNSAQAPLHAHISLNGKQHGTEAAKHCMRCCCYSICVTDAVQRGAS